MPVPLSYLGCCRLQNGALQKSVHSWIGVGRNEIYVALLSLATLDEVSGDTKYFQEQCIAFQFSQLMSEYRDVSGGPGKQSSNTDRLHAF